MLVRLSFSLIPEFFAIVIDLGYCSLTNLMRLGSSTICLCSVLVFSIDEFNNGAFKVTMDEFRLLGARSMERDLSYSRTLSMLWIGVALRL